MHINMYPFHSSPSQAGQASQPAAHVPIAGGAVLGLQFPAYLAIVTAQCSVFADNTSACLLSLFCAKPDISYKSSDTCMTDGPSPALSPCGGCFVGVLRGPTTPGYHPSHHGLRGMSQAEGIQTMANQEGYPSKDRSK